MLFILTLSKIIVKSVYTYTQKNRSNNVFLLANIHNNIYRLIEGSNSACSSLKMNTISDIFKQYRFSYPLSIYTSFGKILFLLRIAVSNDCARTFHKIGFKLCTWKGIEREENSRFLGFTYKPLKYQNRK